MLQFFSGVLKAGLNTTTALLNGPSKTLDEMHSAQQSRYLAFADMMSSMNYHKQQVVARKQYWCTQTYFLAQLINNNAQQIEEIIQSPISLTSPIDLAGIINKLITALDDAENTNKFLHLLEQDTHAVASSPLKPSSAEPSFQPEIHLFNGDVIQLIKELNAKGTVVVTDNAANSHRDGAAKYSQGSVEELFSRYTDSALKMVLHFCDVPQRNLEQNQYAFAKSSASLDVVAYQKRYLKMVLTICAKLVEKKESYLETEGFFNDLFNSFPNPDTRLPIYFDLQNNVYEVPVYGGYTSSHWFADTQELTTVEGIFNLLEAPNPSTPLTITSYAAPDLRKIETSPLDARATSNITLQHPQAEGLMGMMLTTGIAAQCQAAIQLAQRYQEQGITQPVAVVFIMPGCGAFKNPEKQTALQFISTIKYFYPELSKLKIACHIAEYNPKVYKLLEEANDLLGSELGQLNETIVTITHPEIRAKTIKVKEKILDLYAKGAQPQVLMQHITQTMELLTTPPGHAREVLAQQYQQNAHLLANNENPLLKALGAAMIVLGVAIIATGVAFALTGVGFLAGGGTFAGGAGLLVAGKGLFASEVKKDVITLSEEFLFSCQPQQ